MRTLVAMATYSFNRLIMVKVEIANFYCLIGDNRILFLQKCLLNSSPLLYDFCRILLIQLVAGATLKVNFQKKKPVPQE